MNESVLAEGVLCGPFCAKQSEAGTVATDMAAIRMREVGRMNKAASGKDKAR
jgi:hypothetical protein